MTSEPLPGAAGPARAAATLDAERVVRAPLADVRQQLVAALGQLGFRLLAQQLTVISAQRGSAMIGTFSPRRTPITVDVALEPVGGCCRIRYHLAHPASPLAGAPKAFDPLVTQLFGEVQQALDAAIAHVDPDAALRFAAPVWSGGAADPTLTGPVSVVPTAAEQAVAKVGAALGGGSGRALPAAWRQHEGLLVAGSNKVAFLSPADTHAHLAVSAMVLAQHGSLPPPLMEELQQMTVRLEHDLATATTPLVRVEVSDQEAKVVDFLHLQVRIRSHLTVRTLQRCRDCQFEKVANPDLAQLLQRNRRVRGFTSAFGTTIFRGGLSPFVLFGTLFQLKSLDPDYVCPRCQGMAADTTLVTFCPGCGQMCKDAVLRLCSNCGHDYRTGLRAEEFWVDPPELAAATLPVGVPMLGPGGGAVCRTCGGEFTALWRVVVIGAEGQLEEWFVCASTPACAPPSLTTPVSVVAPAPLTSSPPTPQAAAAPWAPPSPG